MKTEIKEKPVQTEKDTLYMGCRADQKLVDAFDAIAAESRRDRSNYLRLLMEYAIEKKIKL